MLCDVWDHLILVEAVEAMGSVEVPSQELTEAERAMVSALESHGHANACHGLVRSPWHQFLSYPKEKREVFVHI